jgi:hypothetical protein
MAPISWRSKRAPAGRIDEPHDQGRGRRLAAAGLADAADALAPKEYEADTVDGAEGLALALDDPTVAFEERVQAATDTRTGVLLDEIFDDKQ